MEVFYFLVFIVGAIVWGLIWGYATSAVIRNKNYTDYDSWFWLGFFFGLIAFVIAETKEEAKASYSSKPTHLTAAALKADEAYFPNAIVNTIPANGWKCRKCGKGNENYTGTCACGNTKKENVAFISSEAQKKWSEKSTMTAQDSIMEDKNAKEKAAAETLLVFKELLDKGAITQEEYDVKKKQLLGL